MKIKFIKDHEVGIKKGHIASVNGPTAKKFIDEGYAEEVKAKKDSKKK